MCSVSEYILVPLWNICENINVKSLSILKGGKDVSYCGLEKGILNSLGYSDT